MSDRPPCTDCKRLQQKAKEYDDIKEWLKKRRRLTNIKEFREVYDLLLRRFARSDVVIEQVASNIVLLCPKCRKPFCIEPSENSLEKTMKDIETLGAKGVQCAFCGNKFRFEEARVQQ